MTAPSANGMTLAGLKRDVNLAARDFHSKYRHKSKFAHSGSNWINHLPVWATVLIFLAIFMVVPFLVFFVSLTIKEWERAKKEGTPIRWKKTLWKSAKYSFFIWIPLYIYRAIKYRNIKGKKSASYAEIQDDQQRLHNPAVTETKPWNASSAAATDNDAKFEPIGYRSQVYDPYSAYAGVGDSSAAPSPPTTAGLHKPPPPAESGDLGTRSPSPARSPFASPSQPPPSYHQQN